MIYFEPTVWIVSRWNFLWQSNVRINSIESSFIINSTSRVLRSLETVKSVFIHFGMTTICGHINMAYYYRAYSIYRRRWLENFDESQFMIVDGTDLLDHPAKWVMKVQVIDSQLWVSYLPQWRNNLYYFRIFSDLKK